jgi:ribosomal protein L11 methyltransferase
LDYIELKVACHEDFRDILQAEFAEAGFASFIDTEKGFDAWAEPADFDKIVFDEVVVRYHQAAAMKYELGKVARQNWNKDWESNYEPIFVNERCVVRATFHAPMPQYAHEIIITPKMSFGTGHHQTTRLMLRHQLTVPHEGKAVLDVGCGTGILAIMAAKLGAATVKACDIDEWAVENSRENFTLNHCDNIEVRLGTLAEAGFSGSYDIVLANINKNVLLDEMKTYVALLKPGALLFLSGFYEADIGDLLEEAAKYGLSKQAQDSEKSWAALVLSR